MKRLLAPLGVAAAASFAGLATGQVPFEHAVRELAGPDAERRLHAVRLLKDAAYPEAAVPLAMLAVDPDDAVQFEAIAAELNIFLAQKVVTRRRVGLVVEVRNRIAAEAAFSAGAFALGPNPVPIEVLTGLRAAFRDDNPRVAVEAVYAFGALASGVGGRARAELLQVTGPELSTLLGVPDPTLRLAGVRVIGGVYALRPQDGAVEETVGDAVIVALNDSARPIRAAAMEALGAMRYDRAIQALTQLFEYYGRGELAESALAALARIGHGTSARLFVAQLGSKSPALKLAAIEGIARLRDPTREADIMAALARERSEALHLAGSFAAVLLSNGRIDAIVAALTRPRLHDQAWQYLSELAPGRIDQFGRYAQDPDARLRAEIADVLALSGDRAALTVVEPMMRDRDGDVARTAQRAVALLQAALRL